MAGDMFEDEDMRETSEGSDERMGRATSAAPLRRR